MFKSSSLFTWWLQASRSLSTSPFRLNEACIYALASGSQRSGLAVVRLSGKKSYEVLTQMTGGQKKYEPRKMYLREIVHPVTREKIDKGLVVWFKEPNSFTGENVCEFHVHGGPAVVTSLISALGTFENLRYAEPGEFSRR
jgi:tRNA U34 5-carboxymethylaminomethyl modifying GTPase MnmE/TrmE